MKNLIAIILIAASFGLFNIFIDPTWKEIGVLRKQQADFNEALNNTEKVKEIRDELLTKYNSFSAENRRKLEKLLPGAVDNVRLIIEIDKVASRHNLTLKDVQVSQTARSHRQGAEIQDDGRLYGTAPIAFSAVGQYGGFLAFLNDLERSLRVMDITGIKVSANNAKGTDEYQYDFNMETYWLKPLENTNI